MLLPQKFYLRPVDAVAPDLLGMLLCGNGIVLRITGVEAYGGPEDSASHCRFGKTARNAPMWGMGGRCYVYLCYGMHWMLNVVTGPTGEGAAVLVRSGEVVGGVGRMLGRGPKGKAGAPLCAGPGLVARALAVDKSFNGHPLFEAGGLELRMGEPPSTVLRGKRIGIGYANEADRNALLLFGCP